MMYFTRQLTEDLVHGSNMYIYNTVLRIITPPFVTYYIHVANRVSSQNGVNSVRGCSNSSKPVQKRVSESVWRERYVDVPGLNS